VLLVPAKLVAAPYPVEIHVEDESDIDRLYFDGEIDAETRERLLSLLHAKVDLNVATATRSTSCRGSPTRSPTP